MLLLLHTMLLLLLRLVITNQNHLSHHTMLLLLLRLVMTNQNKFQSNLLTSQVPTVITPLQQTPHWLLLNRVTVPLLQLQVTMSLRLLRTISSLMWKSPPLVTVLQQMILIPMSLKDKPQVFMLESHQSTQMQSVPRTSGICSVRNGEEELAEDVEESTEEGE